MTKQLGMTLRRGLEGRAVGCGKRPRGYLNERSAARSSREKSPTQAPLTTHRWVAARGRARVTIVRRETATPWRSIRATWRASSNGMALAIYRLAIHWRRMALLVRMVASMWRLVAIKPGTLAFKWRNVAFSDRSVARIYTPYGMHLWHVGDCNAMWLVEPRPHGVPHSMNGVTHPPQGVFVAI
jgi:hypothetical protein